MKNKQLQKLIRSEGDKLREYKTLSKNVVSNIRRLPFEGVALRDLINQEGVTLEDIKDFIYKHSSDNDQKLFENSVQ